MAIDPYSPVPLYRQLAAIIRGKIESGELAPRDTVPSETTLVQEYGVSRDTVRRAMQQLREDGLVITLPQRGTVVTERPADSS